jgi:hypothetical protein
VQGRDDERTKNDDGPYALLLRSTALLDMYIDPELVLEAMTRETNGDV